MTNFTMLSKEEWQKIEQAYENYQNKAAQQVIDQINRQLTCENIAKAAAKGLFTFSFEVELPKNLSDTKLKDMYEELVSAGYVVRKWMQDSDKNYGMHVVEIAWLSTIRLANEPMLVSLASRKRT
ncbi:hypothetical protein ACFBZI_11090 [Moraxella sp. ZJ142]|uniref:hypothetical protein n=1 Tax=Moraxella marmotae TaxID=3344520 RepID=UPI0035D4624D